MQIEHEPDRHRFVARLDQGEAVLEYSEMGDDRWNFLHTFVPPPERGRDVGERLVEHALGEARERGRKVIPTCPFVRQWVAGHPEHQDVIASA